MEQIKRYVYLIVLGCFACRASASDFTLSSPAIQKNGMLAAQYTCAGQNVSPALKWTHPPANTQSFALVMNDPDAPNGNWVHWLIFNLPSNLTQLSQNAKLPIEAVSALNSWNQNGYSGPCPPVGEKHRYFLKLYALDTVLQLSATAQYEDVMPAMQQHILGQAVLVGSYKKS